MDGWRCKDIAKMDTTHKIVFGNANSIKDIGSESIELVVTSPPYPMIEMWDETFSKQDPEIATALKNKDGNRAFDLMHQLLAGRQEWVSNRERTRGYQRAMEETHLKPLIVHGPETTIASGEEMMQQALEHWPDLTAVCAVNDSVAIGAIRAAAKLGRRTSDNLAVVGFDDISWAQMNDHPLTTVHVFKERMGELAAQLLLNCIQNPAAAPVTIVVATELVLRESCGHQG